MRRFSFGLDKLRNTGHLLIDEIIETGISKKEVYKILSEWLGNKPHHFANIWSEKRARKTIKVLEKMLEFRKAGQVIPKQYPWWLYQDEFKPSFKERYGIH